MRRLIKNSAILFVITFGSRLPFIARTLYHWDSVQFALATTDFDLVAHHPHPPGYWVFVKLVGALNSLVHDINLTLILIHILFGFLAAVFLVEAGYHLGKPITGWLAAGLFLTSPVVWRYSVTATNYLSTAAFGAMLLCGYFHEKRISFRRVIALSALAGFWIGIRQIDTILLFPFLGVVIYKHTVNWRQRVFSGAALAAAFLVWYVLFLSEAGGLKVYLDVSRTHYFTICHDKSLFYGAALSQHLRQIWYALRWMIADLGIAGNGLLLILVGIALLGKRRQHPFSRSQWRVFLLAVCPTALFYTNIHIGHPSYWFGVLVIILFYLSGMVAETYEHLHRPRWMTVIVSGLFILAIAYFVLPGTIMRRVMRQELKKPISEQSAARLDRMLPYMKYTSGEVYYRDQTLLLITRGIRAFLEQENASAFVYVDDHARVDWRRFSFYLPEALSFYMLNQYNGDTNVLTLFASENNKVHYKRYTTPRAAFSRDAWFEVRIPKGRNFCILLGNKRAEEFPAFLDTYSPERLTVPLNFPVYYLNLDNQKRQLIFYNHVRFLPGSQDRVELIPVRE